MPKLLVQISDLHISTPGRLVAGRVDTAAALREAVATVLRLPDKPLAVLASGDLVEAGKPEEYAHLLELLAPLREAGIRLLPMLGNHDERLAWREAFAASTPELAQAGPAGFEHYAVDLPGLRLLLLDSVVAGKPHGALCAARLAHLQTLLAEDPHTPTLVALHHPPFVSGIGFMDKMALLEGTSALAELLSRHAQVKRAVCGHIHRSMLASLGQIPVLTCPSTAHQVPLDLQEDGPDAFVFEPPGMLLHAWGEGLPLVSHVLPCGRFEGPYPL